MSKPMPTELNLHRQSRVLDISFDDGKTFSLPCEFLRVYSPSAEVQGHTEDQRVLQVGKESVNIDRLEPVGNYAVVLHFRWSPQLRSIWLNAMGRPNSSPGSISTGASCSPRSVASPRRGSPGGATSGCSRWSATRWRCGSSRSRGPARRVPPRW